MNKYLSQRTLFPAFIDQAPPIDLSMVIVIPSYGEKNLLSTLEALAACDTPQGKVEVITVLNESEKEGAEIYQFHKKQKEELEHWKSQQDLENLEFHFIHASKLPEKLAGVGVARKIGLDEGARRLERVDNPQGVLVCFDADSTCDRNYLQAIEQHFEQYPHHSATSIYFEHPIEGSSYPSQIYKAIIDYELHLRYYINAQRFCHFPFAYQTIGSAMAVRMIDYQKQGGMNRRKAGEDFYFLQKFISLGNFKDLNHTRVIPSPRISNRVPFGTGRAVGTIIKEEQAYQTYAIESFKDIKVWVDKMKDMIKLQQEELPTFYSSLPESVARFLQKNNFDSKLLEIQSNTSNAIQFQKRMFKWFNAFILMKYLHFARDNFYPNVKVEQAASQLLGLIDSKSVLPDNSVDLLMKFRHIDRHANYEQ